MTGVQTCALPILKNITYLLFLSIIISSCNKSDDYLYKIHEGKFDEIGVPSGYKNSKGDTIINIGVYKYCYTDTIKHFGIVMTNENVLIGIDKKNNKLFEILWFDNGPDYISDGLFRIIKDNKIGYADQNGKIIIEPKFDCAFPFENGIAKVSYKCSTEKDGEHSTWKSNDWFYVNKKGAIIKH